MKNTWPGWWNWDLEITPHIEKRMLQRGFNEIDLRTMLQTAKGYDTDKEPDRWKIFVKLESADWEIIVEPDYSEKLLVVITAYSTEK